MEVAERAFELLDLIGETTRKGNKNAITDGCVAMMTCRTAVLGALLNVRINLASIKDESFVKELSEKCNRIEKETLRKEQELMEFVGEEVRKEKWEIRNKKITGKADNYELITISILVLGAILLIIMLTSVIKLNAFVSLFMVSLLLALIALPGRDVVSLMKDGLGVRWLPLGS